MCETHGNRWTPKEDQGLHPTLGRHEATERYSSRMRTSVTSNVKPGACLAVPLHEAVIPPLD